ncbi:ROK family transcriptional regulator [Alicyclobacillus fastidiosus]|uniref:ROK family transcriptional regulator n=1 Tax=Alicyclobacillus fastidiosus TaxID=392011 RepID=A0ABV5AER8_9BACL|nr:ROK family transcriptional regulator [Alicyclobacillus fastidiosus]WEH09520.1 ROK family transcriptional regulator [Alicyclobacillus fastidiosus]
MTTTAFVRDVNRSSVLEFVRVNEPVSRAQIARELGLSRSATSEIVDQLLSEGLVEEVGVGESTPRGGRPSVQLRFIPDARYALGIDIGGTKTILVLSNLNGRVIAREKVATCGKSSDVLEHIRRAADNFIANSGIDRSRIVGMGVGAPGLTDYESGVVIAAPALHWVDVNVKQALQGLVQGPIFVDNDVNMAAVGEKWKGEGSRCRDVVLITIGTGIGAGVIINGSIHRGAHNYAGEIGYFAVDPLTDETSTSDEFGPLDKLASGSGVASQARALLPVYPNSILHGQKITSERVFAAAAKSDPLALAVVDAMAKYTAAAIANIVALLNPGVVIIGGGVAQSAALFMSQIRSRVQELVPIPVHIVCASLGEDAGALGAAATVLVETNHLALDR